METTSLAEDIPIYCTMADHFPDGVPAAFQRLHNLVTFSTNRSYISISRPENGGRIIYRPGATEITDGEFKDLPLDKFTVRKGNYVCMRVQDFRSDVTRIQQAFTELLAHPNIDPQGYCVEIYESEDDVMCLVRLLN